MPLITRQFAMIFFLAIAAFLGGCAASKPEKVHKRYFWPIGGQDYKIEYLDFVFSDRDVTVGAESGLKEIVFGVEPPKPIFIHPYDVASDGRGRVFVSDIKKNVVFVLDLGKRAIRTLKPPKQIKLASGSTAAGTSLLPFGLAVDRRGFVYVTDQHHKKVQVFDEQENPLSSIGSGRLDRPTGIAVDSVRDRIYVVDSGANRIVVFDLSGRYLFDFGNRGTREGEFNLPVDIDVYEEEGSVFVLDALNARVQAFDSEGRFVRQFGERGTAAGSFQVPKGIAVDSLGYVYVTEAMSHKYVIFNNEGEYLLTVGERKVVDEKGVNPGGFNLPIGIDVDANEAIWVVDSLNLMVHHFQYLNERYLRENPIRPEQIYFPPELLFRPKSSE